MNCSITSAVNAKNAARPTAQKTKKQSWYTNSRTATVGLLPARAILNTRQLGLSLLPRT